MYCTYLTTYHGNRLPPFYIGYSKIVKVNDGYHGSVSSQKYKTIWQQELKDHPELFRTKILTVHDSKNKAVLQEQSFQRAMNVIKNPLYVNKAIGKHIDRTGIPHDKIARQKMSLIHIGSKHSIETKQKMSATRIGNQNAKGKIPWNKGKQFSENHRLNISIAKMGKIPWNKGIVMSENQKEKLRNSPYALRGVA